MPALVLLDVLLDLSLENRVALLDTPRRFDDEGFGHLALAVGRDADDDAVVDNGVGEEVGFELGGGDLETFDFDQSAGGMVSWDGRGRGLGGGKCTL